MKNRKIVNKLSHKFLYFLVYSKRASHVGVIASFLIFITFLSFLYVVVGPMVDNQQQKVVMLNRVETTLEDYVYSDLISLRVVVSQDFNPDGNCVWISTPTSYRDKNSFVQTSLGEPIDSYKDDSKTYFKWEDERFLKIFYSEENFSSEFVSQNGSDYDFCVALDSGNYTIGAITEKVYFFETKINEFLYGDYTELKEDLRLQQLNGFAIQFENNQGEIVGMEIEDKLTNIFVNEVPIEYVDIEANIKTGKLYLITW